MVSCFEYEEADMCNQMCGGRLDGFVMKVNTPKCGVGINFRFNKDGAFVVQSFVPGGPAERCCQKHQKERGRRQICSKC
eukprot:2244994-Rhodomonas_salina.4